MTIIQTNDLKKGTRVKLDIGWEAILEDNRRGSVRTARVFGLYEEIGSVYAHDIIAAQINNVWVPITHSAKQQQCKDLNKSIFG